MKKINAALIKSYFIILLWWYGVYESLTLMYGGYYSNRSLNFDSSSILVWFVQYTNISPLLVQTLLTVVLAFYPLIYFYLASYRNQKSVAEAMEYLRKEDILVKKAVTRFVLGGLLMAALIFAYYNVIVNPV